MDQNLPLNVDFIINDEDATRRAENVKKAIVGTDNTAKKSAENVSQTVKKVYDSNVREVEEYTAAVNKSSAAMVKQNQTVAGGKRKWDGLGNSINQLSREMPAFAVSTQIGILALSNNIPILADEIKNLKLQNQQLVASGQKGIPIWKSIGGAIFSWMTILSLAVTAITIYGKEIGEFFGRLFKGKKAIDEVKESQKALNQAFESTEYTNAVKDVAELTVNIDLAKQGMIDADDVVDQYNDALGTALGTAKDLNEVEQQMIDKADQYVQMMLYKAAANLALESAAAELFESAQRRQELEINIAKQQKTTYEVISRSATSPGNTDLQIRAQRERLKNLQKDLKEFDEKSEQKIKSRNSIFRKLQTEEAKLAKSAGINFFEDDNATVSRTAVNNRQRLLDQIAAIDAEYARKSFTKNEEEVQALKDKFGKIRTLVERFNADPKNKAKISTDGLDATESQAEKDLRYRQETSSLKSLLEDKRALWRDYEDYKSTFGTEAAEKKYRTELGVFASFQNEMRGKLRANQEAVDATLLGTASGGQTERVAMLRKLADQEDAVEEEKLTASLARLMTFNDNRLRIEERYQHEEQSLKEKYQGEDLDKKLEMLSLAKDKELEKISEAAFKESDIYQEVNEKILKQTKTQIREKLRLLKDAAQKGSFLSEDGSVLPFTPEQLEELNKVIDNLEEVLSTDGWGKAAAILGASAGSLNDLSRGLQDVNPELAQMIGHLAKVADIGASAAIAIGGFMEGGFEGTLTGITASIGVISKVLSLFGEKNRREKAAQKAYLNALRNIEDGELRLNEIYRERNLLRAEGLVLTLEELSATKEALELNSAGVIADIETLTESLSKQYFALGTRSKRGGFGEYFTGMEEFIKEHLGYSGGSFGELGNTKNSPNTLWVELSDLAKNFEALEELYQKDLLEERGKKLFEQLQDLKDEGADIEQILIDIDAQWDEIWTGTTVDNISNGIIDGLKSGHTAVEDFADNMEELLQNAILSAIQYNVIQKPLQELYGQFSDFAESEGKLTDEEAEQLRNTYNSIVQSALDAYNVFDDVLDQGALSGEAGVTGLEGSIRREMTEATASELTGLYRSTYDIQKRQHITQESILDRTQQMLSHTAKIEQNTAMTALRLSEAIVELKGIKNNTQPTSSGYDRGL